MKKNMYDEPCACQDTTVLALDRTSVSRLVAVSSLFCFFVFVSGYFWGKKHATQAFSDAVSQEAMADRMQLAFTPLGPVSSPVNTMSDNNSAVDTNQQETESEIQVERNEQPQSVQDKMYVAQLVGFGAQRNAKRFVNRLASRGIKVEMQSKASRMQSGKQRTWYQVVTPPADYQQVQEIVDLIKQTETLHDVRIIAHNTL